MDEQLHVLKLVARRFDQASIGYMVSGSVALSLYAQPRMTRDIDIVVEMRPDDASRVVALFETDFDCDPEALRDSIARKLVFNLIHLDTMVKVDLVFKKETEYRLLEFGRRRAIELEGQQISVVSPEDLALSKLLWAKDSHSELQLGDVRNLIRSVPTLDRGYLDGWAAKLGVESLLAEVSS